MSHHAKHAERSPISGEGMDSWGGARFLDSG